MWSPTKMFVMQMTCLLITAPLSLDTSLVKLMYHHCWPVLNLSEVEPRAAPHCRTLDPALVAPLCFFPSVILLSESSERFSIFTTVMLWTLSQYFFFFAQSSKAKCMKKKWFSNFYYINSTCSMKLCMNVVTGSGFSLWYCELYRSSILLLTCS